MKHLQRPDGFPLPAVRTEIADGDTMYDGRDDHYLGVGLSALACIEAALQGRTPKSILDLPCGFGRVTRMLRARYPAARITACDLDRPGVDFTAAQFGAAPVYSVEDLGQLRLGDQYDLIWVGSLVTHLSETQACTFLDAMAACLAPRGVLVVSSHGPSIAPDLKGWGYGLEPPAVAGVLDDYRTRGYGHRGYGGSAGYGISLTDRAWWKSAAASCNLGVVSYRGQAWDGHQDIVTLRHVTLARRLAAHLPSARADADPAATRAVTADFDPVLTQFDTAYYLAAYPDVSAAIRAGNFVSAYDHYRTDGRREGRLIRAPEPD